VAAGRWTDDPAQRAALHQLDRIHQQLAARPGPLARRWRALLRKAPAAPRGLYLWGAVGRGKTFVVDLFYEHLPALPRRRVHFHRFMGEVHARLRALQQRSDPLDAVAAALASEARVLCLDEFFV